MEQLQKEEREERQRQDDIRRKEDTDGWLQILQMMQQANSSMRKEDGEEKRGTRRQMQREAILGAKPGDRRKRTWNEDDWRGRRTCKDAPKLAPLKDTAEIETLLDTFSLHINTFEVHQGYWVANLLIILDEKSLSYQAKKRTNTLC